MICVCCKNLATRKCTEQLPGDCGADLCDHCIHRYDKHWTESTLKAYQGLMGRLQTAVGTAERDRKILELKLRAMTIHRERAEEALRVANKKFEQEIETLKAAHRKRWWIKLLPPKIRIEFYDEYGE